MAPRTPHEGKKLLTFYGFIKPVEWVIHYIDIGLVGCFTNPVGR